MNSPIWVEYLRRGVDHVVQTTKEDNKNNETLIEQYIHKENIRQKYNTVQLQEEKKAIEQDYIDILTKLYNCIEKESMYSDNETLDDITTSRLRFLVIPYELADVQQSSTFVEDTRQKILEKSYMYFNIFFYYCNILEIITEEQRKYWDTIQKQWVSKNISNERSQDPSQYRQNKISRYKKIIELQNKVNTFQENFTKKINKLLNDNTTKKEYIFEDNEIINNEREYLLETIKLYIYKTIDNIEFLQKERILLYNNLKQDINDNNNSNKIKDTNTINKLQIISSKDNKPIDESLKVYTISSKEQVYEPIPPHMKDYIRHIDPTIVNENKEKTNTINKQEYIMTKKIGGRGTQLPACPTHGDSHPIGKCPGILHGRGGPSRGAQGLPDPINYTVTLATDRKQIFKDINPYMFDLDEWARIQQNAGVLPTPEKVASHLKQKEFEYQRSIAIENGEIPSDLQIETTQDEYDRENREIQRARDWDEFKDYVPRGSGNLSRK